MRRALVIRRMISSARLAAVSVRAVPRRATRASTALRDGSGGSWRHQPPVGGATSRATAVERLRSSSGPSCGNNRRSSLWTDSSSGPRGSSSALFHIGPWLHPALLTHIRDASARSAAGPRTPSAMPPAPRRTVAPESDLAFALSLTLNSMFRVTAQVFANLANVGRGRVRRRRAARRCGLSLGIRGYASMSGWHFAGADLAVVRPSVLLGQADTPRALLAACQGSGATDRLRLFALALTGRTERTQT